MTSGHGSVAVATTPGLPRGSCFPASQGRISPRERFWKKKDMQRENRSRACKRTVGKRAHGGRPATGTVAAS